MREFAYKVCIPIETKVEKIESYLPYVGPNFRTENAYVRGLAGGAFSIHPEN